MDHNELLFLVRIPRKCVLYKANVPGEYILGTVTYRLDIVSPRCDSELAKKRLICPPPTNTCKVHAFA